MTQDIIQTAALVVIAYAALRVVGELSDLRKDVEEIWKRMKRLD